MSQEGGWRRGGGQQQGRGGGPHRGGGGQQGRGGGGQQERGGGSQQGRGGGSQQGRGGGGQHMEGRGGQRQHQGDGGGRGHSSQHYQGSGGSGGGRGGRGGRGGGRGGPPAKVEYKDAKMYPDPYKQPPNKNIKLGWKELPKKQEDVVLHKKNLNDIPTWNKTKIDVSVNHYLVESLKKPGFFPFPTIYHYDISYEIERKRKDFKAPTESQQQQQQPDKPAGRGRGGNKRKQPDCDVEHLTKQMRVANVSGVSSAVDGDGGKPGGSRSSDSSGGAKPPAKKLPKHLTNAILNYLIPEMRKRYNHYAIATDGSFNLYSSRRLEQISNFPSPMQFAVTFENLRNAGLTDDEDNATIQVTIQPTIDNATGDIRTIDTAPLANWFQSHKGSLQGFTFSAEFRQTLEAACNAFVKCMPNFRFFSVGRSTMVPCEGAEKKDLGGGLVAWKGISANIAMGWKPYMNIDIANCAFILDRPVMEVLQQIVRRPGEVAKWSNREFDDVKSLLRTCKVSYTVDCQRRSGPIRDIARKTPTTHKFRWEERNKPNKDVSVLEYYSERYGIKLTYPHGPLLEIRKKGTYVPAELCTIKKGQSYNRKLDGNQTTTMIDFARKEPDETKHAVEKRVKDMKLKDNRVLSELGIKVADEMLKVKARVLVPPAIRYGCKLGQPNEIAHVSPADGTWEVWKQGNFNFYQTSAVKRWGVLVVGCLGRDNQPKYKGNRDPIIMSFINCLVDNGKKKGVIFSVKPEPIIIVDNKQRWNCSAVDNAMDLEKYFKNDFKECEIVICVFPRKGDPLYGHIKHAAEVGSGMLTQCVAERNIYDQRKGMCSDSTIQNILFKINMKLNGINHVTVPPFDKELAKQFCTILMDCPVMVLGGDVTHAPPGAKKTLDNGEEWIMPSYAAVTGSLDKTCMPFMTEVRAQRKANAGAAEVIQDLDSIVEKMLKCFAEKAGTYPMKVIYFRDGVGGGQFPEVLHVEMNAIRSACRRISLNYEPKITFITVQKRHKTRIFWNSPNGIDNAPAGTVIDQEIVHPTEIDFYLLSHKGLLGTSRPSRYHVLWDDSDLSQDELQSLAYTLCYMYARCTKSVKMPAPTYYAHLAADRAKKLCEGFETRNREKQPSEHHLNEMLKRNLGFINRYPMHFV